MSEHKCKVCGSAELYKVLDLGSMPNANGLVSKDQMSKVVSYPLVYYWCKNCTFFQQTELINRKELFGDDYTYYTGVNPPAVEHFRKLAAEIGKKAERKEFAVILASNDGTEISLMKEVGGFKKVIGVEPAKNLAKAANEKGLTTINEFFDEKLGKRIASEYGKADVVIANNVFAHIPNPRDFLMGMKELIGDSGMISIEVHWLKSLVENLQIDSLYGEHYFVWDVRAMDTIAESCGLKVSGVDYLPDQQGGSIRVTLGKRSRSKEIDGFFKQEEGTGLYDLESMKKMQKRADERKAKFVKLVKGLKAQGKRVSIWTVPAKIATLLNFCGLSHKEIDCAYDLTEAKIGKYIPKADILVKSEKQIEQDMPDYLIVGAWNYMEFGKQKMEWYVRKGGKLINPLTCEIYG